jgi:predicted ATPase
LRYRLLETTRTYALAKLNEAGETKRFAERHAEYFRGLFEGAASQVSVTLPDWLGIYSAELDNVRAALDWAFSPEGDAPVGIALTAVAVTLWVRLSLFAECRERARRALTALGEDGDDRVRMHLLGALGWSLMYGEGRSREARPILEATLDLAERLGDKDFQLRALWGLCIDQFNNGEFGKARTLAERFTNAASDSPDKTDCMLADRLMAVAFHYLGEQADARDHIDRVHASLHALADRPKIFPLDLRISTQYFRARILWLQGFADQALDLAARNVEEGRANGHALTFCSVLGQSACPIAYLAGDFDAAKKYGAELLEHTERHGIRLWRLWARAFNALVVAKHENIETGVVLLRDELKRAGDARFLPRFLLLIGELAGCFGEANEPDRGLELVEEILVRCHDRQERWFLPELTRIKGELLLKQAPHATFAEDCFSQAMKVASQQGAGFWRLRCAISIARFEIGLDQNEEALKILDSVCGSLTEGAHIADMRIARGLIKQLRT